MLSKAEGEYIFDVMIFYKFETISEPSHSKIGNLWLSQKWNMW